MAKKKIRKRAKAKQSSRKTKKAKARVKKKVKKVARKKKALKKSKAKAKVKAKRTKKKPKKAVAKKAAKKKAPKRKARKAAAKKPARPAVKAPSLSRKMAGIRRPVPRMHARATKRILSEPDVARMTQPGDIEHILSQISDATRDISAARQTKFDIGVKHNGMAFPEQELPSEYGKDRAVLLVVDPTFVFTYWEIRSESLKEAAKHVGPDGRLTLRFYDVGTSYSPEQSNFWDVEVFDRLGNWYLRLSHPDQNICLDIGVKNAQGHFYRITRSNLVKLPQQSLAKPGPIKWMVVTPSGEKAISDVEDYTDADLALLKKILGPYFFDLLMRGRLASITGSSVEAVFYDVNQLKQGASLSGTVPWPTAR